MYDPVRAASSDVPINDTSLWPTINSASNTILELKAELVRRGLVSSNQFALTVQQGAHWMDESESIQWPDGTVLCVRVTPTPHAPPDLRQAFPERVPSSSTAASVTREDDRGCSVVRRRHPTTLK